MEGGRLCRTCYTIAVNSESPWSLDTFARCPRLYQNLVQLRLPSGPKGEAADIGIQWHKLMEDHHAGKVVTPQGHTLTAMFDAYLEAWPDPVVQLASEEKFDQQGFKGRVDAIWEYQGLKVVVEHKSTTMNLDDFITLKTFDRQTLTYFHVYPVDAVLIDVVTRPRHKSYQAARDAVECRRQLIFKTEADVEHFLRDDTQLRAMMAVCADAGYYPRNPAACYQYGQICSFFSSCSNG